MAIMALDVHAMENNKNGSSSRAWRAFTPSLAEWILDVTASMGFGTMTPVQASTIPLFMTHKDVVVESVTGSGKTLAFLIPVIERLLRLEERTKKHHVGAIILSPTRELASQIYNVLRSLLAFHGPSAAIAKKSEEADDAQNESSQYSPATPVIVPQLLTGGDTSEDQDLSYFLKDSPNVLVSTPGRLLHLLSSPHVHCPQSSFEMLVLDEADRLLDLGFSDDLRKILARLPKQRRTGLFSASVSEAVGEIVRVGLRNPVKIQVKVRGSNGETDQKTPSTLEMCYLVTPASHKFPAIAKILSSMKPPPSKAIIYFATCASVDYFQHTLPTVLSVRNGQHFNIIPLHGKHPSKVRVKNLAAFTDATAPSILLTTDVAARGLDIPQVDLVLQVDPPIDAKVFLHRCGRCGRAGRKGLSVLLLQPGREEDYIPFLQIRKTPVTPLVTPAIDVDDSDAQAATESMKNEVLKDRTYHDKAQRGFVSWAKAYSKHQASSIFRMEDLQWEDLGRAWGLLKLPKMPELKGFEGDRTLGNNVDWDSYAYNDKKREEMRRTAMFEKQNNPLPADMAAQPEKNDLKRAWSNKSQQQNEREVRREKRHKKRARDKWEDMSPEEREKQRELERMIEEVKARRVEEERFEEFEGFDD